MTKESSEMTDRARRANLKQDLVTAGVESYLTWKHNEAQHGGNLHLLMRRIYDLWQPEIAASLSPEASAPQPMAGEDALAEQRRFLAGLMLAQCVAIGSGEVLEANNAVWRQAAELIRSSAGDNSQPDTGTKDWRDVPVTAGMIADALKRGLFPYDWRFFGEATEKLAKEYALSKGRE